MRLLLLVLLVGAPFLALTLHSASKERGRAVASWQERSRRLAQLATREEKTLLAASRQFLLAMSVSSALQSTNRDACKKALGEVLASYPTYANLGVADTNGEVLASVFSHTAPGGQADRELIQRVLQSRSFAIGQIFYDPTNGAPFVSLGSPVFDMADHVRAVIFALMPLDWYLRAGSELAAQVPRGATWTVINRAGTALVRHPMLGRFGDRPPPSRSLVQAAFGQVARIVMRPDLRGNPVYHGLALMDSQLAGGEVASILSIPRAQLFAPANRALKRNLIWLGLAAGLALVIGWVGSDILVIRPVKALVHASARLATGDLSARTGLRHGKDELGRLTRTFDHMAQALEQRELERQLAEETLQTRDTLIRELPLLPAAVCVCDRFGNVELYNQSAVELWGCDPHVGLPQRRFCGAHRLFHTDGTPMSHTESPAADALRTGMALRNRELVVERPDGKRVPVLANVVPLRDLEGSVIGVVSCYQDITDRKRAEDKLRESNDRLQFLSRRLVESQELERRHIARELHDEVGQTLTVAGMNLQAAVLSARRDSLAGRLKESLKAVERVLEQVRGLSLDLRPSMLDDLGLEPTLRWYISRQSSTAGLSAHFHSDVLEHRLDPIIETACFRIAQEALTNVVRHARAHSVSMELRRQDGLLHLFVRDDGVGFDVATVRGRAVLGASLGVLSMEERATLSDGGLEFKSALGQGTQVHAWFPLKWRLQDSS